MEKHPLASLILLLRTQVSGGARIWCTPCWLDHTIGFAGCSVPLVDVVVVALELIFTSKAIVATVFAPRYRTREGNLLWVRAMFSRVMALQVRPTFGDEAAMLFFASEFLVCAKMALHVLIAINRRKRMEKTIRKAAGIPGYTQTREIPSFAVLSL